MRSKCRDLATGVILQLLDLLAGVILQYWLTLVYLQEGVGDQRQEGARCEAPTDDGQDDGLVMIWTGRITNQIISWAWSSSNVCIAMCILLLACEVLTDHMGQINPLLVISVLGSNALCRYTIAGSNVLSVELYECCNTPICAVHTHSELGH